MDEPLLCCRLHIHQSDDYAVQETANFIALVRQHYPEIQIEHLAIIPGPKRGIENLQISRAPSWIF